MKLRALLCGVSVVLAGTCHAEDLVIGVPASLTGVYAFVGKAASRGMELAVEEVNASRELGGDRKIKLMIEDDGSNNNQAITLLTKFANSERALAIAGPTASATALAAAPASNQLQIPMIGIAVSTAINAAGPWSTRILTSPPVIMDALAEYAYNRFKPKSVMTIGGRDNDGAMAQSAAVRKWMQGKVTLLPEESALMADTDFSALATKISSLKPSLVFITMNDATAANIIIQARQSGVGSEVQFIGNAPTAGPTFLKIGGKAVEGTVMGTDALPVMRSDALNTAFVAAFQKKFGEMPENFAAQGYTMIRLYARAISSIKGTVTRDGIRSALVSLKNVPVVIGDGKTNFSFDAERNPVYKPVVLTIKDQKIQMAP